MRAIELHASAKAIQRSKGRSSVAAAAYRAGVCLHDERTGLTHDYSRKQGVEFNRIYLPENAPQEYRDRETLWNAVERKENRSNSCTARELEVAFPYEFNAMQRREAGDSISRELLRRYGCAVDIAFHAPDKNGDERNYHAHILFTDRAFDISNSEGWARKKYRDLSNDKIEVNGEKTTRGQQEILSLREFSAQAMNKIAERDGLSVMVEHLSFEARGIDKEPQIHLGSVANDMQNNGKTSERGEQNKKIIDLNKQREAQASNQSYEKFDEFAGAKRAEFQSWSLDEKVGEDRRCDVERRKQEKELDEYYGDDERKYKKQLAEIEGRLTRKGVAGTIRNINGSNRSDAAKKQEINKSLANIEMRKNERRDVLIKIHDERKLAMEKRHSQAKEEMEAKIAKARSSFKEDESEGKGEQGGRVLAKKVKRDKSSQEQKTAKKLGRSRSERKPSYSGNGLAEKQKPRLVDKHRSASKTDKQSEKKTKHAKPENDLTPPRGPSMGR